MPNISGLTSMGALLIGERSEATPGLFNNMFSTISTNIDQINSDTGALTVSAAPGWGKGSITTLLETSGGTLSVITINVTGPRDTIIFSGSHLSVGGNVSASTLSIVGFEVRSGNTIRSLTTFSVNTLAPYSGSTVVVAYPYSFIARSYDSGGAWYHVRAYGAVGDGTTDDTVSIRSTISAAQLAGGGVILGPQRYRITSTLTVPEPVSFLGSGGSSELDMQSAGIALDVGSTIAAGARYGAIRDIQIRGNGTGTIGLYVGLAQAREFANISIQSFTDAGLVINGTQNCNFDNVVIRTCGASGASNAGLRMNHNASGNVITNLHIGNCSPAGILILNDDSADTRAPGFVAGGPTNNLFVGPLVENPTASTTTLVAITTGTFNEFVGFTFSSISSIYALSFYSGGGASVAPAQYNFVAGQFQGVNANSGTTAIRSSQGFNNRIVSCFFQSFQGVVECDNQSRALTFNGQNQFSSTGTFFIGISGGLQDTACLGPTFEGVTQYDRASWWTSGTALSPSGAFRSEVSLGFYRSAASILAISYGTFVPSNVSTTGFNEMSRTSFEQLSEFRSGVRIDNSGNPRVYLEYNNASAQALQLANINTNGNTWSIGDSIGGNVGEFGIYNVTDANRYFSFSSLALISKASLQLPSGSAIGPVVTFTSEISLGWYRSGVSTMALSYGTFNLNQARTVSMRTLAASSLTASAANTNTIANECGFTIGGASGASLFINSGGTTYIFNSALSAANA